MSSAILYLAIVAIWACVLVPRWLRRPHEHSPEQDAVFESGHNALAVAAGEPAAGDGYAPDAATEGEQGAVPYGDPVAWEDTSVPDGADGTVEATYSVTATYSAEVTYTADEVAADEYYDAPAPGGQVPHHHVTHGARADGWQQHVPGDGWPQHAPADGWEQHAPAGGGRQPHVPVRGPGPSARIVQARRRTLTMVLLITVAVMGAAFIGLTPWWTAIPPFVMLGAYLLLLREAAQADAEHAHRWAEAQARAARAARRAELARERARQAEALSAAQPAAQIINLSELAAQIAKNEPYDQYADAEFRAVGD